MSVLGICSYQINSELFIILGLGLKCYYCESDGGEEGDKCDDEIHGEIISCQIDSPEFPHYGDVCAVGHTGLCSNIKIWTFL